MRGCAFVLALALVVPPAATAVSQDLDGLGGAGWSFWRVSAVGGAAATSWATANSPGAVGAIAFDHLGNRLSSGFNHVTGWGGVAEVAAPSIAEGLRVYRYPSPNGSLSVGALADIGERPDPVFFFLWAAGEDIRRAAQIDTHPGAQVTLLASGEGAFMITTVDSESGAGAEAQAWIAGASAGVLMSRSFTVNGTFIGIAGWTAPQEAYDVRIETPGVTHECYCYFRDVLHRDPPGEYRVTWTGAGVDLASPMLAGVDAVLPPLPWS